MNKDFDYVLTQDGEGKVVLNADDEEAATHPPAPPLAENGRCCHFCCVDDLQEEDK